METKASQINQETTRKRGQKISASEIDKLIGMRIRIARNMAGKKQDELAQYLGLTLQQTQKYENGKNKISVNILVKIAKYFQIPVSYFIPSQMSAGEQNAQNQTIKTLESIDTMPLHNVAENWKPIGVKKDFGENLQAILQEIQKQGLEKELFTMLKSILNSKK